MLKHYDLLSAVYKKYCKIGGDVHWLTCDGYLSLLRDCNLLSMNDEGVMPKYVSIFDATYAHHAHSNHSKKNEFLRSNHSVQLSGLYGQKPFFSKDPWTGKWRLAKDKNKVIKNGSCDEYKLRKIGDLRIIGCLNNAKYAEIRGSFNRSNYKKATLQIAFKQRRIKNSKAKRIWKCTLFPPESVASDIRMSVKWEEINKNAANTKEGSLKLFKFAELDDDDADIPSTQFCGLSRSEFFDAMLSVAATMQNEKDLYAALDELVAGWINEFVFVNMLSLRQWLNGREIAKEIKSKMKANYTVLMRLFKKYAAMNDDEANFQQLDGDEWCAMAVELCKAAKTINNGIWKNGGKPQIYEIMQCFVMSASDDENEYLMNDEREINFSEFQLCLVHFASVIFKYCPNAKYKVLAMNEKMNLVMRWCKLLEAQKVKICKRYTRSDTLKNIKRIKSIKLTQITTNDSNHSSILTQSPKLTEFTKWSDLNVAV